MCLRPSCSTTSTIEWPGRLSTSLNASTVASPSSSSTPSRSRLPTSRGDVAVHLRQIGLGHLERRVHEPVGQLAVVRQQQQALGLGVEPAHVEQPARPVDQLGPLHDRGRRRRGGPGRRTSSRASRAACSARGAPGRRAARRGRRRRAPRRCRGPPAAHLADDLAVDLTRPAAISSSAARRDATPAWASTFCSRTPSGLSWSFTVLFRCPGPRRSHRWRRRRAAGAPAAAGRRPTSAPAARGTARWCGTACPASRRPRPPP